MTEPGTVLLKRHVRPSKADPLVDEVKLLQANPHYAFVRYPDGRKTTVSTNKFCLDVFITKVFMERLPVK